MQLFAVLVTKKDGSNTMHLQFESLFKNRRREALFRCGILATALGCNVVTYAGIVEKHVQQHSYAI